jgi:hypothetical protein
MSDSELADQSAKFDSLNFIVSSLFEAVVIKDFGSDSQYLRQSLAPERLLTMCCWKQLRMVSQV